MGCINALLLTVAALHVAACGRVSYRVDAGRGDAGRGDAGPARDGDIVDDGAMGPDAGVGPTDGSVGPRSLADVAGSVSAADCSRAEIAIRGGGFSGDMQVTITDALGGLFDAADVAVLSTGELRASVVLAGATTGAADVTVTWPDAEEMTLPGALAIPSAPYTNAVFVDGDAPAAGADGTRAHPFRTIAAGILGARMPNVAVLVDGSAMPYAEFTLPSDSIVRGCPWSAGATRPIVAWRERHEIENGATRVEVEGLAFMITLMTASEGIVFSRGSEITIRDCIISGDAVVPDATFVVFDQTVAIEIVDSWLTRLHHIATPVGNRVLRGIDAANVQGFHLHRTELSDIGFEASGTATTSELQGVRVRAASSGTYPHDVRIHNVLAHDFFHACNGVNYLTVFSLNNINSFDWIGAFELHHVTIDDLRHADPPATTTVTGGHVAGVYVGTSGGTRTWRDNIAAHFAETDEPMMVGSSSYYGFWTDGFLEPAPSPQPMNNSLVFDVGTPLPVGANPTNWASGFANQVSAGVGTLQNSAGVDPRFDLTPGASYYRVTNAAIATGGSDGGSMGAFGGPEGGWTPLSQRVP